MNKPTGGSFTPFAMPKNYEENISSTASAIPHSRVFINKATPIQKPNQHNAFLDLVRTSRGTTYGQALWALYRSKPALLPKHFINTNWIGFVQSALRKISFSDSNIANCIAIHEEERATRHLQVPNVIKETILFFEDLFRVLKRGTKNHIHICLDYHYINYAETSQKMADEFVEQLIVNVREVEFKEDTREAIHDWINIKSESINEPETVQAAHENRQTLNDVLTGFIDSDTLRYILVKFKMIGPAAIRKPYKWIALRSALESLNLMDPQTDQEASDLIFDSFAVRVSRESLNRRVDTERKKNVTTRFYAMLCDDLKSYKPAKFIIQ